MYYLKTVNVTNHKNVLVQIPAWIVKKWQMRVGDTMEVCYDAEKDEIRIKRTVCEDVQG